MAGRAVRAGARQPTPNVYKSRLADGLRGFLDSQEREYGVRAHPSKSAGRKRGKVMTDRVGRQGWSLTCDVSQTPLVISSRLVKHSSQMR